MTRAQQEALFIEWGLYEPHAQRLMIDEYIALTSKENCSKSRFLAFLKDKMDIKGYREKTGLA